jgi:hypothetical protein
MSRPTLRPAGDRALLLETGDPQTTVGVCAVLRPPPCSSASPRAPT